MAISITPFHLVLIFLIIISVKNDVFHKVDAEKCYKLAVIGGGCPDETKCADTCSPCYRGIGTITSYCQEGGGGIMWGQCVCIFHHAPCPVGPPRCPKEGPYALANVTYFYH
ncbi:hypothetical protein ACFE04_014484 [Oxalis oulophora]